MLLKKYQGAKVFVPCEENTPFLCCSIKHRTVVSGSQPQPFSARHLDPLTFASGQAHMHCLRSQNVQRVRDAGFDIFNL